MKVVKLHVDHHAPFHFGDASGDLAKTFSSDQLFSALANNISLLYGPEKIADFLQFVAKKELTFSSLYLGLDFFATKENHHVKTIYFLPRPKIDFYFSNESYRSFKEFKKIEYVSSQLLNTLSASWNREKEAIVIDAETVQIVSGQFALLKEEIADLNISEKEWEALSFLTVHVRPGVEVNRLHSTSEKYFSREDLIVRYQHTKHYTIKPFLYFYLEGELPSFVKAAIYLLADEGIGGQRSQGCGLLKRIEMLDVPEAFAEEGMLWMNIATYFPKKDEVDHLYSYEMEKRNGYIYSQSGTTTRKKSIFVLREGSLFTEKVEGQILDLKPDFFQNHPVYFYGKPMLLRFGGGSK